MTEDIKEILDKLSNRKQETLIQGLRECQLKDIEHPFITREEYIDKLLDYITNLQQENEFLKLNNPEMNIEHFRIVKENKRKIDNLRKENKRLKEKINTLKSNFEVEVDDCEDYKKWYRDYKSRCEKAIYYIWKEIEQEYDEENDKWLKEKIDNLSNILNGSDENG